MAVPSKLKVWFGCVAELTIFFVISVAFLSLVKVHLTVSPAATMNVAVSPVPVELLSSQLIPARAQPACACSWTV